MTRLTLLLLTLATATCLLHADRRPQFWPLTIGNATYARLELALTPEEHTRGLMSRRSLPDDAGMLFVFRDTRPRAFWMKNTLIPLDILFLDAHGKVVATHTMNVEPPCRPGEPELLYELRLPSYPSDKSAQFAIELNAGQLELNGIRVGDTIDLHREQLLRLIPQGTSTP